MKKTFLLIDDDADDRMLFCHAIEESLNLVSCLAEGNGNIALEKLDKGEVEKPDIIFIDINMPGRNGWYFLKLIKRDPALQHIPVIMYSTAIIESDIDKAVRLGATLLFKKPDDFEELENCLKNIYHHLTEGSIDALIASGSPWFRGTLR